MLSLSDLEETYVAPFAEAKGLGLRNGSFHFRYCHQRLFAAMGLSFFVDSGLD